MVSTRFNSFVLGLVFIFLALGDSVAYTHKAKEEMVMVVTAGNAFVALGGDHPSTLEKENVDALPSAVVEASNRKLGGRKMMEKVVVGKEVVKEEGIKIGGASKISGRNMNLSKKPLGTSQEHVHHENDANWSKPKLLGSERLGNSMEESIDLHKPNPLSSQDSEAVTSKGRLVFSKRSMPLGLSKESDDSFQNLQSHKLVDETTSGFVNLMNRDYSGAGSPPHSNYEPMRQQHEIP